MWDSRLLSDLGIDFLLLLTLIQQKTGGDMHYLAKILVKEQNIKKIEKKQLINTAGDCLAQYVDC